MINNFEKWFTKTNESLSEEVPVTNDVATQTDVTVSTDSQADVGRKGIMSDVDAIMTSLDALSVELTEELENVNLEELHETAADSVVDYMFKAPKARKSQKKVNSMHLKVAGLEAASSNLDGDKKKKVGEKIDQLKTQAKELQTAVDDKFGSASNIVKSALASEKIKGKLEVIKTSMGDDGKDSSDLKAQAQKLKARLKEEEAALKDAEPSDEQKEKIKKEQEAKKKADAEKNPEQTPAEETPAEETDTDKIAKIEGDIDTYAGNIEDTNKAIKDNETKVRKLEGEKEKATDSTKIESAIEGLLKRINADKEDVKDMQTRRNNLKKELAKLSPREALAVRADLVGLTDLANEILEKQDWQLDGTVLYNKYNALIMTLESKEILNESFQDLSIKDKFSRLL